MKNNKVTKKEIDYINRLEQLIDILNGAKETKENAKAMKAFDENIKQRCCS